MFDESKTGYYEPMWSPNYAPFEANQYIATFQGIGERNTKCIYLCTMIQKCVNVLHSR